MLSFFDKGWGVSEDEGLGEATAVLPELLLPVLLVLLRLVTDVVKELLEDVRFLFRNSLGRMTNSSRLIWAKDMSSREGSTWR